MVAYAFNIEASLVYIVNSRTTNQGYTRENCLNGGKKRNRGRKEERKEKKKEIKKGKKTKKSKCEAHFFYSVGT